MLTGKKIRQIRKNIGMTQSDLADKIGYLNQSQVAKIEKGYRKITEMDLKKFSEVLDVRIETLIENGKETN